jgi:predicted HTH domain antitoxin
MGKTTQLNLRVGFQVIEELEEVARVEGLSRTEMARRLLIESLRRWRIERALDRYRRGEISLERAAMEARLPLYEMMDLAEREGIRPVTDLADLREGFRALLSMLKPEIREQLEKVEV